MTTLHPSLPAAAANFARASSAALHRVLDVLAAASRRSGLDYVEIPPAVTQVSARTRRFVRQARLGIW